MQTAGLAKVMSTYSKSATEDLSSMGQTMQSLMEQGTRDDSPTGLTPRKRVWQYVDQWELTQNRELILKNWRQRSGSLGSDTFIPENLPLPMEDSETDAEVTVDASPSPETSLSAEPEGLALDSPIAVSLESSASSMGVLVVDAPSRKATTGSRLTLPTILTERSRNVDTRSGPRRAR